MTLATAAEHAAYVGGITGLPCASTEPLPHHCHTAASDAPDRHDASEPNGDSQ